MGFCTCEVTEPIPLCRRAGLDTQSLSKDVQAFPGWERCGSVQFERSADNGAEVSFLLGQAWWTGKIYKTWGLKAPQQLMDLPWREGRRDGGRGEREPGALWGLVVTGVDACDEGIDWAAAVWDLGPGNKAAVSPFHSRVPPCLNPTWQ